MTREVDERGGADQGAVERHPGGQPQRLRWQIRVKRLKLQEAGRRGRAQERGLRGKEGSGNR